VTWRRIYRVTNLVYRKLAYLACCIQTQRGDAAVVRSKLMLK
jgi:hypothetical protein